MLWLLWWCEWFTGQNQLCELIKNEQDIEEHIKRYPYSFLVNDNKPLAMACRRKQYKIVKTLLDAGAIPSESILMDRVASNDTQSVKYLLDAGANPNASYTSKYYFWYITAIGQSINPSCPIEILESLLIAGADPNKICYDTQVAFQQRPTELCYDIKKLFHLLRYGGYVWKDDTRGQLINRMTIVCDMMLYMDNDIPSDWIREIKGCLY